MEAQPITGAVASNDVEIKMFVIKDGSRMFVSELDDISNVVTMDVPDTSEYGMIFVKPLFAGPLIQRRILQKRKADQISLLYLF